MELRLLVLGAPPFWLPAWRGGKILLGSSKTADASLPGALQAFHCVVEVTGEGVLVHDLARAGDVLDETGTRVPPSGLAVKPGHRFRVAGSTIAVMADETAPTERTEVPCLLCGSREMNGRMVASVYLCPGCHGVVDVDPKLCTGYELVARLGSGGMGTVYLGHQAVSDRLVAVKVMNRGSAARGPEALARFLREIRVLAHLEHPAIVRVLDARSVRGLVYLVSEFVPGGDALARLRRIGCYPEPEVVALGVQLAAALDFAHGRGVIHRDVKPANVLLAKETAKLTDFGLAKDLAGGTAATGSGALLGTVAYAAPEQLRDARSAGSPADVYGLAATLYHLATGHPPREGPDLVRRPEEFEKPPASAHTLNATLSPGLSIILDSALRADPRERPPMKALAARLAQLH